MPQMCQGCCATRFIDCCGHTWLTDHALAWLAGFHQMQGWELHCWELHFHWSCILAPLASSQSRPLYANLSQAPS